LTGCAARAGGSSSRIALNLPGAGGQQQADRRPLGGGQLRVFQRARHALQALDERLRGTVRQAAVEPQHDFARFAEIRRARTESGGCGVVCAVSARCRAAGAAHSRQFTTEDLIWIKSASTADA
jgi:hypothetical protein